MGLVSSAACSYAVTYSIGNIPKLNSSLGLKCLKVCNLVHLMRTVPVPVLVLPRLIPFRSLLDAHPAASIRGCVAAADAAPLAVGINVKKCGGPKSIT